MSSNTAKTVLVIGASGRTGQLIVRSAIDAGYRVIALVRDASRITPLKNLEITVGDPMDPAVILQSVHGVQAVVVALASGRSSDAPWAKSVGPKNLLELTTKHLLAAGASRIVVVSAAGVGDSRAKAPRIINFLAQHTDLSIGFNDHDRADQLLVASNCNYTIIRPTGLTNKVSLNSTLICTVADTVKPQAWISRNQVARFALDALNTTEYDRRTVIISDHN